jgi:hypothetical protein
MGPIHKENVIPKLTTSCLEPFLTLLRVGTSPYALEDNPEPTDLAAVVGEEVARDSGVQQKHDPVPGLGWDCRLCLCYGGLHHRLGPARPAPCRHGSEMTVTMFLPCATSIAALEPPLHRDAHAKAPQGAGLHR